MGKNITHKFTEISPFNPHFQVFFEDEFRVKIEAVPLAKLRVRPEWQKV
jgi:hypothetical protein